MASYRSQLPSGQLESSRVTKSGTSTCPCIASAPLCHASSAPPLLFFLPFLVGAMVTINQDYHGSPPPQSIFPWLPDSSGSPSLFHPCQDGWPAQQPCRPSEARPIRREAEELFVHISHPTPGIIAPIIAPRRIIKGRHARALDPYCDAEIALWNLPVNGCNLLWDLWG